MMFLITVKMAVDCSLIQLIIILVLSLDHILCQESDFVPPNSCHGTDGVSCSGNGICSDGMCYCYPGHSGTVCEIDDVNLDDDETATRVDGDLTQCPVLNGQTCNGHGRCVNGICVCDVRWSGEACELTRTTGFCNVYRQCAECTAFGIKCAQNCNATAIFRLVEDLPSSATDYIFHRCRYRSLQHHCSFFYQLSKETVNNKKVILVKACPDWLLALNEFSRESTQKPNVTGLATVLTWSVVVPLEVTSPTMTPSSEEDGEVKGQTGNDGVSASLTTATFVLLLLPCLFFNN